MKREPFIFTGLFLQVLSVAGAIFTTKEYGDNLVPVTTCEAITDLTVVLAMLTGIVLVTIGRALHKEQGD